MERLIRWCVLLCWAVMISWVCCSTGWAQTGQPSDDAVVNLARVLVSERGFEPTDDDAAIWTVVRNVRAPHCRNSRLRHLEPSKRITHCRRGTAVFSVLPHQDTDDAVETELGAMRRLSRMVTGMAKPRRQRQVWIANLTAAPMMPKGWVECGDATAGQCDGTWRHYADQWIATLERARQVMRSPARCSDPRTGPVIAWGNDQDHWMAQQRRLVEVRCGRTRNHFFAKPISRPVPPA